MPSQLNKKLALTSVIDIPSLTHIKTKSKDAEITSESKQIHAISIRIHIHSL